MFGFVSGWAGLAKVGVGLTSAGLALTSSGIVVWAFTGASVANAMGLAIGAIGASFAVSHFLKNEVVKVLEESNSYLRKDIKRLNDELVECREASDRDRRKLNERIREAEDEAAVDRMRAQEYRLRLEQGGLLAAAELVDRFREKPRESEAK